MNVPDCAAIETAAGRIRAHVRRTPILTVDGGDLDLRPDLRVTLKLEMTQHTGSFKPRGAFNRILAAGDAARRAGVIAASGGNHGVAVAYVAGRLGIAAEIFVPETIPAAKLHRLARLGATVRQQGAAYDEAQAAAAERGRETGALAVHPYDDPDILAGAGTLARELEQQSDEWSVLLVATGGGGLIGGAAAWLRGRRQLISVEPRSSACLHAARRAGHPVPVPVGGIAVDSLGARQVGALPFAAAALGVTDTVVVADADIRQAQRLLWDRLRLVAEPGGATALAGLCSGAFQPPGGTHVAVVICGANVDPASLSA